MLRDAINYLQLGYSVIPLKPCGKEPLISWQEFQKRKASESEVRAWFQKWPKMNIGIVTGSISGIAIIDLDGTEGFSSCSALGLVSTCTSISGNGRHLWYQNLEGLGNSVRRFPGIDVRAEGGYIVAPPSVHESGKRYRFLTRAVAATHIPPFPKEIFASDVSKTQEDTRNKTGWIAEALEGMKIGNIDDTLFKVCSRLRNDGYSENDALTLLRPHAERAGAEGGHLEDKIRNVWGRYEPSARQSVQSPGHLVLHSPANAESVSEYDKRSRESTGELEYHTGYPKFDALTKGLRRGELLTVAARTGVGKTNWILPPIKSFCEAGKKVVLFSTEMSFDQIWSRYKSILGVGAKRFDSHQFYICDEFTPVPERIEEALKQVVPDLFIFDHINHVGTEHHELAKFMMALKELARKFNIPGIVTAQLSRAADWVENGERVSPRLSMIKGSGSIEEISAQVLLLSEKRVHDTHTEIEGVIDKNRHGDKGLVTFGLMKAPYRMTEL